MLRCSLYCLGPIRIMRLLSHSVGCGAPRRESKEVAELLPLQCLADIRAFEREWTALRECVSPWSDKEQLRLYFPAMDWPRLLLLARDHGVVGQLAACLNDLARHSL